MGNGEAVEVTVDELETPPQKRDLFSPTSSPTKEVPALVSVKGLV